MSMSTLDNSFENDNIPLTQRYLINTNNAINEENNTNEIQNEQKFYMIPKTHKKTFYCILSLFIVGMILLIVGIEEYIRTKELKIFLCFIILGIIVLIPGGFYTYKFIRLCFTSDIDEREEMIDEIPKF